MIFVDSSGVPTGTLTLAKLKKAREILLYCNPTFHLVLRVKGSVWRFRILVDQVIEPGLLVGHKGFRFRISKITDFKERHRPFVDIWLTKLTRKRFNPAAHGWCKA